MKPIEIQYANKALNADELNILNILLHKVNAYKENLKLKPGDKLRRKSDSKIFTYVDRATIGFNNIYVEELEHYVYAPDFEKIMP